MSKILAGRVALVTGASSGIGVATARALAAAGQTSRSPPGVRIAWTHWRAICRSRAVKALVLMWRTCCAKTKIDESLPATEAHFSRPRHTRQQCRRHAVVAGRRREFGRLAAHARTERARADGVVAGGPCPAYARARRRPHRQYCLDGGTHRQSEYFGLLRKQVRHRRLSESLRREGVQGQDSRDRDRARYRRD